MLAIFDVEGVLYDAEYLPILAEQVNKEKDIWDITKKGIQGLINWEKRHAARIGERKDLREERFKCDQGHRVSLIPSKRNGITWR